MRSLLIPAGKPLDQQWYEALNAIAGESLEAWAWLGPKPDQLTKLYDMFVASGMQINPDMRPHNLDLVALAARRTQLEALGRRITDEEPNPLVKAAYIPRIEELVANFDLLLTATRHDTAGFKAANDLIYVAPDDATYNALCGWLRDWATKHAQSTKQTVRTAAQQVLDVLPHSSQSPAVLGPDPQLFEDIRRIHMAPGGFYPTLFQGMDMPLDTTQITAATGDPLIKKLLSNLEAQNYTLTDAEDPYWGVSYTDSTIVRPQDYNLSQPEFLGVVGHEIGSHLLERINGQKQPLRLLGLGLDRYESGNEGRALIREQVTYQTWGAFCEQPRWMEIILRYQAIAYAFGTAREQQHSFAETFAMLMPIYMLIEVLQEMHDISLAKNKAEQKAWNFTSRVLKGTDGQGGAYLKDLVYLQGNLACWRAIRQQPGLLFFGDLGKFDISNPRHLAIMHQIVKN